MTRMQWSIWIGAILAVSLVSLACNDGPSSSEPTPGETIEESDVEALRIVEQIQLAGTEDVIGIADSTSDGGQLLVWVFPRPEVRTGCALLWVVELGGDASLIAEDVPVSRPLMTGALFSPEGNEVAYAAAEDCAQSPAAAEATLVVVDVAGGARREIASDITSLHVWTSDGRLLFDRGTEDVSLWQADAEGDGEEQLLAERVISVSPDGARSVTKRVGPLLEFRTLGDDEAVETAGVSLEGEAGFAGAGWSPDSQRYVYFGTGEEGIGGLSVIEIETAETRLLASLEELGDPERATVPRVLTWSPDSLLLLLQEAASAGQLGPPLLVVSAERSEFRELTEGGGAFLDAQWTEQGGLLLYVDGHDVWVAVMDVGQGDDDLQSKVEGLKQAFPEPIDLTVE